MHDNRISGAELPNANSDRLAIVGFHTSTWIERSMPSSSVTLTYFFTEVITSIALHGQNEYLRHEYVSHNGYAQEQVTQYSEVEQC